MPTRIAALTASRTNRILIAILAVSVAARVASALIMGQAVQSLPGIDDQLSYDMLAQRVMNGYGFTVAADWWPLTRAGEPTAHWSYLYTLFLALVYSAFDVQPLVARLIQAIAAGILTPLFMFRIGRRVAGESVGLVAAGWSAIYGYLVYYSSALMTEPFYMLGILWTLDLALSMAQQRNRYRQWLLLGMAIGVTVMLRQVFLMFVPVLLAWVWICNAAQSRPAAQAGESFGLKALGQAALRSAGYPLASLAVLAVMIAPWTLRNYTAFGRPVLLNTNAGFAFYWANHPIYGTQFVGVLPEGQSYLSLIPPEMRALNEAALDSALMQAGLQFVADDPGRYALLSLSRVATYFMFWPSPDSGALSNGVRVLSFGVALPFMLYGLVLAARRWRAWSLLYLFVFAYTGIHLLSWALIRYRLPVDIVLLIFAAYGLVDLGQRLRAARRSAVRSDRGSQAARSS